MTPPLRRDALGILKAALVASDPREAVLRHLRVDNGRLLAGSQRYRLDRFRRIFVLGAGKAGAAMAQAVERLLGRRITAGLINVKYGHTAKLRRVELNECGHPVPDEAGVAGTRRILEMAASATADDLVLCLISGGGSALLPSPAPSVTLGEKQDTTKMLLACGASIDEINAVRKHISTVKGGLLARAAQPATVLTLILSDVIGDPLDVIGSGPTAPDPSTFADARGVFQKYGLFDRIPSSVRERILAGLAGQIEETPKPGAAELATVTNRIVGSNQLAVDAALAHAKARGYRTLVLSTLIEGETREVARMHAAIAREVRLSGRPVRSPACIISGGETTVTLSPDSGKGGRNQEFALAAALDLAGAERVLVLSAGTDGTDGPTDAAGAIATGETVARARAAGLDARAALTRHDAYPFFDGLGDLIRTGPTNTNVMDIRLLLIG